MQPDGRQKSLGGKLLESIPWAHLATALSVLVCAAAFAAYIGDTLSTERNAWFISRPGKAQPHRPMQFHAQCASLHKHGVLRWQQLEADTGSMVAAVFIESKIPSNEQIRYLMLFIYSMQTSGYTVTYYHTKEASLQHRSELLELGSSFGASLSPGRLRVRPWVANLPRVRLFVAIGPGLHPRAPGIGLVNLFLTFSDGSSAAATAGSWEHASSQLLSYDYVVFTSSEALVNGLVQLTDALQQADARAQVAPTFDPLPPAFTFSAPVKAATLAARQFSQRRDVLNVAKDRFESMQALRVFLRMQQAGQLPNGTNLLLVPHTSCGIRSRARLLSYVDKNGLGASVQLLRYTSLKEAVSDPAVASQTLVQWHLAARHAEQEDCGTALVDGMLQGFVPVAMCTGLARQVIVHGSCGYQADHLDDVVLHTASLYKLPQADQQQLSSAAVTRAQLFTFKSFHAAMERVDIRGMGSRHFRHLLAKTLPALRACAVTNVSKHAPNAAVIIEARPHFALEYVILNTMAVLARSSQPWSLHIFSSSQNEWLVTRLSKDPRLHNAHLHQLQENATVAAYNHLLKTPPFWEFLASQANKALIFQTDSLLLGGSVDEFMDYDYVGAPWHLNNDRWEEISKEVPSGVGNGGLSLRTLPVMVDIASADKSTPEQQEDIFFARGVSRRNASKLAPRLHAYKFGIEVPCEDLDPYLQTQPFSIHAAWYHMTPKRIQGLLSLAYTASVQAAQ